GAVGGGDAGGPSRGDAPTTPAGWGLGRLLRFARKELREVLRDRRTVLTLLLMPPLLYTLLTVGFRTLLLSGPAPSAPEHLIAVGRESDARLLAELGWHADRGREAARAALGPPESAPERHPDVRVFLTDDLEREVQNGNVHLGLRFRR